MKKVIIYGASGHGKVILDILGRNPEVEVAGFFDTDAAKDGEEFCGYQIKWASDEALEQAREGGVEYAVISIGDGGERLGVSSRLSGKGFKFFSAIHPTAVVGRGAEIGEGTVIAATAVVNPYARVGKHSIINTGAAVEHDNIIGDFVHIAPGANLGGAVSVGDFSEVFTNATVLPKVKIGAHAIVGAGAVVLKDVPDNTVVVGNPAREIKKAFDKK